MYLTEKIFDPFVFSSKKHHHHHYSAATKNNRCDHGAAALSFDDVLLPRFEALTPPPPVVSLSWLHSAFDLLSFTHTEAAKLLSGSKESPLTETGVDDYVSFYLDDSVKFLHINNYVVSEIDRFRRRALRIKIALHLLTSEHVSSPDKMKKARDYLSEVEDIGSGGKWKEWVLIGGDFAGDVQDLVKDLALKLKTAPPPPPRGKVSAVRRTVHATGLVSVLICGAAVSALRGSEVAEDVIGLMAPAEFAWADTFKELTQRLSDSMLSRREIREVGEVEARVKELIDVIDDVEAGKGREKLNGVVGELGRVTEELREGLGKLANGVNGGFNAVMHCRRCVLDKVSRSLRDN